MSSLGAFRVARKPRRGDLMLVELDALSLRGLGLRRLEWQPQWQKGMPEPVALRTMDLEVRLALPGELVGIEIAHVESQRCEGRVLHTERASPLRCEPRCMHFSPASGRGCGGCALQNVPYPAQLDLKRETLLRALREQGQTCEPEALASCAHEWYYRNKMEYSFGPDAEGVSSLGLHPVGSRSRVIALQQCLLQSEFSAQLVVAVQDWLRARGLEPYYFTKNTGFLRTLTVREGKRTGERLVGLTSSEAEWVNTVDGPRSAEAVAGEFGALVLELAQQHGERLDGVCWRRQVLQRGTPTRLDTELLHGRAFLHEELHLADGSRLRFEVGLSSFFQTNTLHAELLYSEVMRAAMRNGAPRRVFDLYCGTGTIGLCLAPQVEQVLGVEMDAEAVRSAQRNASFNGFSNVSFVQGDVGKVLQGVLAGERFGADDLVIVDPPRSGLGPVALEHLLQRLPARLLYVSCNPFSMAAELAVLRGAGYEVQCLQPVDMFPQTGHVESVLGLRRVAGEDA